MALPGKLRILFPEKCTYVYIKQQMASLMAGFKWHVLHLNFIIKWQHSCAGGEGSFPHRFRFTVCYNRILKAVAVICYAYYPELIFFRERKLGVKLGFASRPCLMGGELRIFRLNTCLQMGTEINVRSII
jgi:hypothetical protein